MMKRLSDIDFQLIQQIINERNIKKTSHRRLTTCIKKYLEYHQNKYTMNQLIQEAKKQQDKGINPQNSKLREHLIQYRIWLSEQVSPSTQKAYMVTIKSVYRHFNIQIPELPPFKIKKETPLTYEDIPTKEHIRKVLGRVNSEMKALILFQSSSGTALQESVTITVGMFLQSVKEYLNEGGITVSLIRLEKEEQVIPLLYLERVKTNKYYYTCCSDEATKAIIHWLRIRITDGENMTLDTKIFPQCKNTYTRRYADINKEMGWGIRRHYSFFRSHSLRKYHASNIGCSVELIDELQGRGKSIVHEAYIKDRPQKIKEEYMKYMYNVTIYSEAPPTDDDVDDLDEIDVPRVTEDTEITDEVTCNRQVYELTKDVGRLEARIELLEERIKQLGGMKYESSKKGRL